MKQVQLGKTGPNVSEMCLGTMMFGRRCDEAEADRIVSAALEAGVNFLDTAAAYSEGAGEEIVGRILRGKRDKVFLATKVRGNDGSTIRESINDSLRRLQTDRIDLYLIHWPREGIRPREVMAALHEVVTAGKARYVGCCNYPAWLVERSNAIAAIEGWTPLTCNQIPYNLIERGVEVAVLPHAMTTGTAITVYRPLLMGLLTGKYRPGQPPPSGSRAETKKRVRKWLTRYAKGLGSFLEYAERLGVSPVQLAIAWVRHCPAVTCPIVGIGSQDQLDMTLRAFDLDLTDEQHTDVAELFDAAVKEESGGGYRNLRRNLTLVSSVGDQE